VDPFAAPQAPSIQKKEEPVKKDPTKNLASDDAWAMGKDIIDLSNLGGKKKDDRPEYLKANSASSGNTSGGFYIKDMQT